MCNMAYVHVGKIVRSGSNHQGASEKFSVLNFINFIKLYLVCSGSIKKGSRILRFLESDALQGLNAQTLYFACTPDFVKKWDDLFCTNLSKGMKERG